MLFCVESFLIKLESDKISSYFSSLLIMLRMKLFRAVDEAIKSPYLCF